MLAAKAGRKEERKEEKGGRKASQTALAKRNTRDEGEKGKQGILSMLVFVQAF